MISANKIIGSLVYRTREALNGNKEFKEALKKYMFSRNCLVRDKFSLWHYPGTPSEISTCLLKIGEHHNGSRLKFPAILNYQTIKQDRGEETVIHYNLAIVGSVKSDWTTEQRENQVFDLLLRPVYDEFMKQVQACKWFANGYDTPSHEYYEVFTTGSSSSDLDKTYGDYIDAIELHDLRLTLNSKLCDKDIKVIIDENNLVTSDIKNILKEK